MILFGSVKYFTYLCTIKIKQKGFYSSIGRTTVL